MPKKREKVAHWQRKLTKNLLITNIYTKFAPAFGQNFGFVVPLLQRWAEAQQR